MISASIVDQGTIDTTLPTTSDPMYQPAALCLFLRQQFAAMRTGGFEFQKAEVSDVSTYKTNLLTWLDDARDRETEIIKTGVSEIVANLPDILTIGAAYMSGGATAAIGCAVNVMLERLLGGTSGAVAANEGGTVDTEAIENKLEEIREQIETVLTTFSINLYSDGDSQAIFTAGPPE